MKVAVKQAFDNIDSIMFEAALTHNAAETQYKQKEYVSWCRTKKLWDALKKFRFSLTRKTKI